MLEPVDPLGIVLRSAAVYFAVLVGLRLAGKREVGQLTTFDLVVLLLIANAVQNAMLGPDTSLTGGLIAAGVLLAVNTVVARLRLRSPRLRHLVEGTPTLLISEGRVIRANLAREGLDEDVVAAALREHGVASVEEVEIAVLEIDGTISVISRHPDQPRARKSVRFPDGH